MYAQSAAIRDTMLRKCKYRNDDNSACVTVFRHILHPTRWSPAVLAFSTLERPLPCAGSAGCRVSGRQVAWPALIHQPEGVSQHHERLSAPLTNPAHKQGGVSILVFIDGWIHSAGFDTPPIQVCTAALTLTKELSHCMRARVAQSRSAPTVCVCPVCAQQS